MTTYNWNNMVDITVPVGLNGWMYSGFVIVNGIRVDFPVGVATTIPEPAANLIQSMIDAEEAAKPVLPPSSGSSIPTTTSPNMHLVTNADGATEWQERLAYETVENTVVLEETTVEGEGEIPLTTPFSVQPEAEKTYEVTYNGTVYDCPGVEMDMGGVMCVVLGNASLLEASGGNDEAPFAIMIIPPEYAEAMGVYGAVMDANGATSVTLSITGEVSTIKKLDEKFLPKLTTKQITITIADDGTVTSDTDFETAWAMTDAELQAGITIVVNNDGLSSVQLSNSVSNVSRRYSGDSSTGVGQFFLQFRVQNFIQWDDMTGQSDGVQYITWYKLDVGNGAQYTLYLENLRIQSLPDLSNWENDDGEEANNQYCFMVGRTGGTWTPYKQDSVAQFMHTPFVVTCSLDTTAMTIDEINQEFSDAKMAVADGRPVMLYCNANGSGEHFSIFPAVWYSSTSITFAMHVDNETRWTIVWTSDGMTLST